VSFENNVDRRQFLGVAAFAAASLPWKLFTQGRSAFLFESKMPSLHGASNWLNSPVLDNSTLRGKVVLVNFWTYSCINWRRSLPYLRAWSKKYRGDEFALVGVHSPEFQFERNVDNVRQAAAEMMIDYPIAIDNEYAIWRAFSNDVWPALYFVGKDGHIRDHMFGEGEYDRSEHVIQALLREAGVSSFKTDLAPVEATGAEAAADWPELRSNENYLGSDRAEGFASPGGLHVNRAHIYVLPQRLNLNNWALDGDWLASGEAITGTGPAGRIAYRFHARDVHLVMGPASERSAVRFRVLLDGQIPASAHGVDVNSNGYGEAVEPRLYQLIRQGEPIADRSFEIQFLDPGIEAYSFTFG